MTEKIKFRKREYNLFCKELEKGLDLSFYTHTSVEQEFYKEKLMEKYGDNLMIEKYSFNNSYAYEYKLKNIKTQIFKK